MSYSDFTLEKLERDFHLTIDERQGLFADIPSVPVEDFLARFLEEFVPLGLAINTEKARSEYIIAPILGELRRLRNRQVSVFSGIDFNVEPEAGLKGTCDFLISRSPAQMHLRAPVIAVTEAKREDVIGGIPQCIAATLAAQRFNQKQGAPVATVYGVVTSGANWKFLQLVGSRVTIGIDEYLIADVGKILGILNHMAGEPTAPGTP